MRGHPLGFDAQGRPPPPGTADDPRWLTYRCSGCGKRNYSGYTVTALQRAVAAGGRVRPSFFCADCGTDTELERAELQHGDDGTPYAPAST